MNNRVRSLFCGGSRGRASRAGWGVEHPRRRQEWVRCEAVASAESQSVRGNGVSGRSLNILLDLGSGGGMCLKRLLISFVI